MNVLVAIHHRVAAWTIPLAHLDELRRRFPHINFLHSHDRDSDIALAPSADIAFALGLSKEAGRPAARVRGGPCPAPWVRPFSLAGFPGEKGVVAHSRGNSLAPD